MYKINDKLKKTAEFEKVILPSNKRFFELHGMRQPANSSNEDECIDLALDAAQNVCDSYAAAAYEDSLRLDEERRSSREQRINSRETSQPAGE